MGKSRFKVTYQCDEQCEIGGCTKENYFLLEHNYTIDVTTLAHKRHSNDEFPKMEFITSLSDNGIEALIKILKESKPSEDWSEKDIDDFDSIKAF